MRLTVVYRRDTLAKLARLWESGPDRAAIAAASDLIDRELAVDADRKGRPLVGGDRVFVAPPLWVVYTVSPDDRLVTIWEVSLYDPLA
jgi:hypothetical protein